MKITLFSQTKIRSSSPDKNNIILPNKNKVIPAWNEAYITCTCDVYKQGDAKPFVLAANVDQLSIYWWIKCGKDHPL